MIVVQRFGAPVCLAGAFAGAFMGLGALGACGDLKRADDVDTGNDGGVDAATDDGGGSVDASLDAAPKDAGDPPPDFACIGNDSWVKAAKARPECAPRQVKIIEAASIYDPTGVSIARTPAGRVGIVFNSEQNADEGELHFWYFKPTTPTYPAPVLIKRAPFTIGFHEGYLSKITASAPDTLGLLTFDCDDVIGEVHYRKLVNGTPPLTDDVAFTGVKRPAEIAVASDPAGSVYAAARIANGATTARLSVRRKAGAAAFADLTPIDLATSLAPKEAPGIGASAMFIDPGSQVHLAYHYNSGPSDSAPRYHLLAGTMWSDRKTVDNLVPDGLSGYGVRVVTYGTKKYAAYFHRRTGQGAFPTAELRLATWESLGETPTIEVIEQAIKSDAPLEPVYSLALAIDKYGLLHLATITGSSATLGTLEYRRQTRAGGVTKWVKDIVDGDVIAEFSPSFVDLVVDENARPHIAYISAKDGTVKYATRFDR